MEELTLHKAAVSLLAALETNSEAMKLNNDLDEPIINFKTKTTSSLSSKQEDNKTDEVKDLELDGPLEIDLNLGQNLSSAQEVDSAKVSDKFIDKGSTSQEVDFDGAELLDLAEIEDFEELINDELLLQNLNATTISFLENTISEAEQESLTISNSENKTYNSYDDFDGIDEFEMPIWFEEKAGDSENKSATKSTSNSENELEISSDKLETNSEKPLTTPVTTDPSSLSNLKLSTSSPSKSTKTPHQGKSNLANLDDYEDAVESELTDDYLLDDENLELPFLEEDQELDSSEVEVKSTDTPQANVEEKAKKSAKPRRGRISPEGDSETLERFNPKKFLKTIREQRTAQKSQAENNKTSFGTIIQQFNSEADDTSNQSKNLSVETQVKVGDITPEILITNDQVEQGVVDTNFTQLESEAIAEIKQISELGNISEITDPKFKRRFSAQAITQAIETSHESYSETNSASSETNSENSSAKLSQAPAVKSNLDKSNIDQDNQDKASSVKANAHDSSNSDAQGKSGSKKAKLGFNTHELSYQAKSKTGKNNLSAFLDHSWSSSPLASKIQTTYASANEHPEQMVVEPSSFAKEAEVVDVNVADGALLDAEDSTNLGKASSK